MSREPEQEVVEDRQIVQISVKESVMILIRACELARIANSYQATEKIKSRDTKIYFAEGKNVTTDPTLAHYIEVAEKQYIENNSQFIIEEAYMMIEKELDSIRGLVNG